MAVHGVSRSTRDLDILVTDAACLEAGVWAGLEREGFTVLIRRGDADDPLAGVVGVVANRESPVEIIVGRARWQREILDRARPATIDDVAVPVATAADLIVLKLYAAGPQDAWDIEQLLAAGDRRALATAAEAALPLLPEDSRRLWARLLRPR